MVLINSHKSNQNGINMEILIGIGIGFVIAFFATPIVIYYEMTKGKK